MSFPLYSLKAASNTPWNCKSDTATFGLELKEDVIVAFGAPAIQGLVPVTSSLNLLKVDMEQVN
jgi:hypothetical protein